MDPLTLRVMRDRIRRRLGRSTSVEAFGPTDGVVGDPHPNQLNPTNIRLNEAVEETISEINIRCSIGGGDAPVSQTVAAQTADGPLRIDLSSSFKPREAQVNEITRVWWNDGSTNTVLRVTGFRDLDRDRIDYYSTPPGVPQIYWVDSYVLWVSPAPSAAGTIYALAGMALGAPVGDDDIIGQLPGDLYRVVLDGAALRICADQPNDAVMRERAQILGPLYMAGLTDIKQVFNSMASQYQPRLTAESYRTRRAGR